MKVFILQIQRAGTEDELFKQVLAVAETEDQAKQHVAGKFTGWDIDRCAEVEARPVHFVLGELE